jgi:hypothetical protein
LCAKPEWSGKLTNDEVQELVEYLAAKRKRLNVLDQIRRG